MLDRSERILKFVCLVLGALLLYQLAQVVRTGNPLSGLTIPAVPTLAGGTNAVVLATNRPVIPGGSNSAPRKELATGSNNAAPPQVSIAGGSNLVTLPGPGRDGTNFSASRGSSRRSSNSVPGTAEIVTGTNVPDAGRSSRTASVSGGSNLPLSVIAAAAGTNAALSRVTTNQDQASNAGPVLMAGGTGGVAMAGARGARRGGPASMGAMDLALAAGGGARRGGPGGPLPELPPAAKARVERIYRSELLGAVVPPRPAALLGIAGDSAMISGTNGQSGLVKVGDSIGGIKLLKIGINRVLVEEDGQKKELTIFSGFGGESLMSKPADNPQ